MTHRLKTVHVKTRHGTHHVYAVDSVGKIHTKQPHEKAFHVHHPAKHAKAGTHAALVEYLVVNGVIMGPSSVVSTGSTN